MKMHAQFLRSRALIAAVGAITSVAMTAGEAFAHHPMGGKTPSTFMEGFLSGIGHPVIGPDHLAFIVAIGIAAALSQAGIGLIASFVSASTLGVLLHTSSLNVPLSEQIVALSVVGAGSLLALGYGGKASFWLPLAAVAGLFHGYAFGEAVVGSERSVIGAYLMGIGLIAVTIAFGAMLLTSQFLNQTTASALRTRAAGVLVACVGVVMLAGSFISA